MVNLQKKGRPSKTLEPVVEAVLWVAMVGSVIEVVEEHVANGVLTEHKQRSGLAMRVHFRTHPTSAPAKCAARQHQARLQHLHPILL